MGKFIYTLTIFLVFQGSNSLLAQNKIKWMTWEQAMEKSKVEKKKIFIDIYTEWCGWCKKMDKSTLSEGHLALYLNNNYYAVKFDAERINPAILKDKEYKYIKNGTKGYHELAIHFLQGQMSYPSMVFLDEDLNLIQAIPGYQDVKTFEMIITYFGSNSHKTIPWQRYMNTFQRDAFFNMSVGKN